MSDLQPDFIRINTLSIEYDYDSWISKLRNEQSRYDSSLSLMELLAEFKEEYAYWQLKQLSE
jgi:hypothetical protein